MTSSMQTVIIRSAIALFVLFLVLFVSWREMVNPVFNGIAACFQEHNEQMNGVYEQAVVLEDLAARKELICAADVESVPALRGCLRLLKSDYLLADVLIHDIPSLGWNTKKRINFDVRDHNRMCPEMIIAEERV